MLLQHTFLTFFTFITLIAFFFLEIYLHLYYFYEYGSHLLEVEDSKLNLQFDFIIVGCGTAGSLIAHRLSSDSNLRILILEAGGSGGPLLNPPSFGTMLHGTMHDWQYESEPQTKSCLAMEDQKCRLKAGKIIGGSSKLNNLVHVNSYAKEIVNWFGNKYNETEINEHLSSIEDFDLPYESLNFKTQLPDAILNAASELKFNVGNSGIGFKETVVNQHSGSRWTTSHTLLNSPTNNTTLFSHSVATKIIFENKKATSVEFERFGRQLKAFSKNGIILAAGAIGTPKLLLLSGIGPRNHLESLNITTVADLPVGENLMDHISTGLDLILLDDNPGIDVKSVLNPVSVYDYVINGKGPLTFSGCEVIAVVDTCELPYEEMNCINDLPDLQLMVLPVGLATDNGAILKYSTGITNDVWNNYFSRLVFNNSITIMPIVLHPKSKGYVQLRSNLTSDSPLIDFNYLDDDRDVEILYRGIELIKKILETDAMKKIGAKLNTLPFPGCDDIEFDTIDYWICYVRHLTLTTFHPAGTCKMGPPDDESSVVDFSFEVIGTTNLYVADASIFPEMPSGNTNTAVAIVSSILSEQLLK